MAIYRVVGGGAGEGGTLPTLNAAARVAAAGDTVVVAPGVYREALKLETPGVTWRSEQPGQAIIDGGWAGDSYDHEFSIQVGIGAANIQFGGFAIRNCEGRAFVAGSKAKGSVIENLRIDNCGTSAFVLTDAVNVAVRGVIATRLGMAWEAGRRPSVAGSVILVRATDCLIEDCTVAYGHGEGIDIGRGSRGCTVRGCTIFDNSHLGLYFNRCIECIAEGNLIFLTGEARRNAGDRDNWPAGIVFGDEGSENMRTNPHSAGNIVRGNVVVNCGTLLHVRNNAHNYDTLLDAATRIERNTFIAGPLTTVALQIDANEQGGQHGPALLAGNAIDLSNASGAVAVRGGAGLRWRGNAWSVAPAAVARGEGDVVGDLKLTDPGVAIENHFPLPGFSLDVDAYRPLAESPVILGDSVLGALQPLAGEPPVEPPPDPEPEPVDWDVLLSRAAAVGVQLATLATALADAREQVAVASLAQDAAAGELAALLASLDETRAAND